MSKKILFLSSVNFVLNPRVLKEVHLAKELGYDVSFVGFKMCNWSDSLNDDLIGQLPGISAKFISAGREPLMPWLLSSIAERACRVLYKIFPRNFAIIAVASSKRSLLLLKYLRTLNGAEKKFDLIIAHTLSCLYPAYIFSKKCGTRFAFDVEDYHPGEAILNDHKAEKTRREYLLRSLLPAASYTSSAAPLISEALKRLVPTVKPVNILNYFPGGEFHKPLPILSDKIKLVWFSQNISVGRGLELVFEKWGDLKRYFELTLIGKIDGQFYQQYIAGHPDIIIKGPMLQAELFKDLSNYDIGLAIELNAADYNRQIALTNKILAYFQAGLFILATDTPAQKEFIADHPEHGLVSGQTPAAILDSLMKMNEQKQDIRAGFQTRFNKATLHSWESQATILAAEWEKL